MTCKHSEFGWRKFFDEEIRCGKCGRKIKSNLNDIKIAELIPASFINLSVYLVVSNIFKFSYYDSVILSIPLLVVMHIIFVNFLIKFHE